MKLMDLSNANLPWVKIGANPLRTNFPGAVTIPPTACIVNDHFSLLYIITSETNPQHFVSFVLYSWDEQGNICQYNSSGFINGSRIRNLCSGNVIFQVGNTFSFSDFAGGAYKFIVPTVFIPGASFTIPVDAQQIPAPCGGGTFSASFYLSQQDLIAYEFIQDFPESSNYWASIYDKLGDFIGGGYIGNAFNDLFNRLSASLPPNITAQQIYYKNGYNFFGNFGDNGAPFQRVGYNQPYLFGDPSTLQCGIGNQNVFVSTREQVFTSPYALYGWPGFSGSSSQIAKGITDYDGFFVFPDTFGIFLISKDFIVKTKGVANITANGYLTAVGFLSKTNKLYGQIATGSNTSLNAGDIYITDFNPVALGIAPPPVVSNSVHHNLANYHRAVSPDGLFQA